MQPDFWNDKRPAGVPLDIDVAEYKSVVEVFERSCKKFADRPALSNMGVTLTYAELERYSAAAAYYQAVSDSRRTTMITLANMCIQIPFLLILAPWLGVTGILLALPLSTIVLATGVVTLLRRQFSRRICVNK